MRMNTEHLYDTTDGGYLAFQCDLKVGKDEL